VCPIGPPSERPGTPPFSFPPDLRSLEILPSLNDGGVWTFLPPPRRVGTTLRLGCGNSVTGQETRGSGQAVGGSPPPGVGFRFLKYLKLNQHRDPLVGKILNRRPSLSWEDTGGYNKAVFLAFTASIFEPLYVGGGFLVVLHNKQHRRRMPGGFKE